MEIRVADNAGFCYGVMRAIKMADAALRKAGRLYSLGPIIHNPQVVSEYEKKGLKVVDDIGDVDGPVLIRSHGVSPDTYRRIPRGVECIDATCPFVKEAQDYARKLHEEGYFVVIVGDKDHPEVRAHVAYAGYEALVINSPREAERVGEERVGVISQTTQSVESFVDVISELVKKCKELRVFNTICDATERRQASARELAKVSDVMIIIGGRNSANTRRLFEICREYCPRSYHIETSEEVEREWFAGTDSVGITAGASTPSRLIDEVVEKINGWFNK